MDDQVIDKSYFTTLYKQIRLQEFLEVAHTILLDRLENGSGKTVKGVPLGCLPVELFREHFASFRCWRSYTKERPQTIQNEKTNVQHLYYTFNVRSGFPTLSSGKEWVKKKITNENGEVFINEYQKVTFIISYRDTRVECDFKMQSLPENQQAQAQVQAQAQNHLIQQAQLQQQVAMTPQQIQQQQQLYQQQQQLIQQQQLQQQQLQQQQAQQQQQLQQQQAAQIQMLQQQAQQQQQLQQQIPQISQQQANLPPPEIKEEPHDLPLEQQQQQQQQPPISSSTTSPLEDKESRDQIDEQQQQLQQQQEPLLSQEHQQQQLEQTGEQQSSVNEQTQQPIV